MSDGQEDAAKKATESDESKTETQEEEKQPEQVSKPSRPRIGTPIQPTGTESKPATPSAPGATSVTRPRIGTPVGTPVSQPSPQSNAPAVTRPTIGAPVGAPAKRQTIGTPVGTKPTVGTPVGTQAPSTASAPAPKPTVGTPRPTVSTPSTVAKPAAPAKKVESKEEVSRRNFLRGLAVLGGIVAIAQFGALGPFLQGTVGATKGGTTQVILDSLTGQQITADSFNSTTRPDWATFVYPRTGDPNVDNDTFRQCVIIRLPKGFTAPGVSVSDSSGNNYVGFSRVCVHLWCLWSYVPGDMRMECPCHGSQYVPGFGTYPALPSADNQPPGLAVQGPASLQTPPNNQLPLITLKYNSDGTFSATGIIGQIGCGQHC